MRSPGSRPRLVRGLCGGLVRATKQAIAAALAADPAVAELVPAAQIFSVERSTVPALPAVELIGVSSERVDQGPMVRHELQIECTVSHATEDAADLALDAIVQAVRQRVSDAEHSTRPIALATREGLRIELKGSRWSVSASGASGVVRGASVSLSVEVSE